MRNRWFLDLRGRRPRRPGIFGYRATQNTTMSLPPIIIGFVQRRVLRSRKVGMRLVQPMGMTSSTQVTFGPNIHPAVRRTRRVPMRLIQPGRPPI